MFCCCTKSVKSMSILQFHFQKSVKGSSTETSASFTQLCKTKENAMGTNHECKLLNTSRTRFLLWLCKYFGAFNLRPVNFVFSISVLTECAIHFAIENDKLSQRNNWKQSLSISNWIYRSLTCQWTQCLGFVWTKTKLIRYGKIRSAS